MIPEGIKKEVFTMSEFNQSNIYERDETSGLKAYITRVFTIMGGGLALTGFVAWQGYKSLMLGRGFIANLFYGFPQISWILLIAEFGIVIGLSAGLRKMSTGLATGLFLAYALITGLTFSYIPFLYGIHTVFTAFVYAAVLFVSCAIIGHTTSVDLSRFSGLMIGGLVSMVVVGILSIFIPILRNNILFGYIGLILFLFLTAWDMQKIKGFYYGVEEGRLKNNLAIYGAFELYLDFLNMFLYLLRILGRGSKK